jgi:hypothetical protein
LKLLLDQNLSRRMLPDLLSAFPGSSQVQPLDLKLADDKTPRKMFLILVPRPRSGKSETSGTNLAYAFRPY